LTPLKWTTHLNSTIFVQEIVLDYSLRQVIKVQGVSDADEN